MSGKAHWRPGGAWRESGLSLYRLELNPLLLYRHSSSGASLHVLHVEPFDVEGLPFDPDLAAMLVEGHVQYWSIGPIDLVPGDDISVSPAGNRRLAAFMIAADDLEMGEQGRICVKAGTWFRKVNVDQAMAWDEENSSELWEEWAFDTIDLQRGLCARSIGTQMAHDPERRDAVAAGLLDHSLTQDAEERSKVLVEEATREGDK